MKTNKRQRCVILSFLQRFITCCKRKYAKLKIKPEQ